MAARRSAHFAAAGGFLGVCGWRPDPVPILSAAGAAELLHQVRVCARARAACGSGAPAAMRAAGAAQPRPTHARAAQTPGRASLLWLDEGRQDLVVSLRGSCGATEAQPLRLRLGLAPADRASSPLVSSRAALRAWCMPPRRLRRIDACARARCCARARAHPALIAPLQGLPPCTITLEGRAARELVQALTRHVLPCWERVCSGGRAPRLRAPVGAPWVPASLQGPSCQPLRS